MATGPHANHADPMSVSLRNSMIPVTVVAGLSFSSTAFLICYLSATFLRSKRMRKAFTPQYQSVFLIFNLLLGDFIQAMGFGADVVWLAKNKVLLNALCDYQGSLIQIGDVAGSSFVTTIAIHSFLSLVLRKEIPRCYFFSWVAGIWLLSIFTGVGMPMIFGAYWHRSKADFYWTLAGSWCWIREDYTRERLFTHYFFIFVDQVLCVAVYITMYIRLTKSFRARFADLGPLNSNRKVEKAARIMLIYPLAYICCTMPLAAARVHTMVGGKVNLLTSGIVGTIFTSSGLVNSIMYGITRHLHRRPKHDSLASAQQGNYIDFDRFPVPLETYKVTSTVHSEPLRDICSKTNRAARTDNNLGLSFNVDEYSLPGEDKIQGSIFVSSETVMRSESMPVRQNRSQTISSRLREIPFSSDNPRTKGRMSRSESEISLQGLLHTSAKRRGSENEVKYPV